MSAADRGAIEDMLKAMGYEAVQEASENFEWVLRTSVGSIPVGIAKVRKRPILQLDLNVGLEDGAKNQFQKLSAADRKQVLARLKLLLLGSSVDYRLQISKDGILEEIGVMRHIVLDEITNQSLLDGLKRIRDVFFKALVAIELATVAPPGTEPQVWSGNQDTRSSDTLFPKSWEEDQFPHAILGQPTWDRLTVFKKNGESMDSAISRLLDKCGVSEDPPSK